MKRLENGINLFRFGPGRKIYPIPIAVISYPFDEDHIRIVFDELQHLFEVFQGCPSETEFHELKVKHFSQYKLHGAEWFNHFYLLGEILFLKFQCFFLGLNTAADVFGLGYDPECLVRSQTRQILSFWNTQKLCGFIGLFQRLFIRVCICERLQVINRL